MTVSRILIRYEWTRTIKLTSANCSPDVDPVAQHRFPSSHGSLVTRAVRSAQCRKPRGLRLSYKRHIQLFLSPRIWFRAEDVPRTSISAQPHPATMREIKIYQLYPIHFPFQLSIILILDLPIVGRCIFSRQKSGRAAELPEDIQMKSCICHINQLDEHTKSTVDPACVDQRRK